ncbi:MAG: ATP-binding cassette domain-containing protein [Oscillospiraceae bacterium]|jgi:zinc transport system ATP-binding protein|nr:ATP-binding cassette domain-containing protein [Oscillospiraceae bacterium]
MKHDAAHSACGACCTQFRHLTVRLEGLPVLDDVSLHMHCGQITAVIGPNGAGKTTLCRALLGQVRYQGDIHFTDAADARIGRPRIGYVPQHLAVEPLAPVTVLDFLGAALSKEAAFLPPSRKKRAQVLEALTRTGAQGLIDRRLGALSGGEAQRVLLALALEPLPDLLLLDEPVSGVDAEGLAAFYELLDGLRRDYDISILLISHDFAFVRRFADQVVLLDHRVAAHGKPDAVLASAAFARLFPGYVEGGRKAD